MPDDPYASPQEVSQERVDSYKLWPPPLPVIPALVVTFAICWPFLLLILFDHKLSLKRRRACWALAAVITELLWWRFLIFIADTWLLPLL